jgi:hypothetical protein
MKTSLKPKIYFRNVFTTTIPDTLESDTLYISIPYNSILHKCACGCGEEVSTPLSPSDWELSYNGESVTLNPSIGNWSYKCRSHYWIRENQVVWAGDWSQNQINESRKFHEQHRKPMSKGSAEHEAPAERVPKRKGWRQFIKSLFQ